MKCTLPTAVLIGAALAVLGGGLTACGGQVSGQASPATSAASSAASTSSSAVTSAPGSSSASASSTTTAASSGPASGAGGSLPAFTPAGTQLAFGQQATVPFALSGNTGALGVTVTGITQGTEADLASLELGDRAAGLTPYYVSIQVTNLTGADFDFSSLGLTYPLLGDGTEAQEVSIIGDFTKCPNEDAGKDFHTAGKTYTTCVLGLAGGSSKVTGAKYLGHGYDEVPGAPEYELDKAVTWRQ